MNVKILLANKENFFIIKNFIPLYREYIGKVYNELPNKYGIFSYDDSKTLEELCDKRERWLQKPDELFPYIIYAYDRPVGYMLVSKVKQPAFEKSDYYLNVLFIVSSVRRRGIASTALKEVFDFFGGIWEVHTSSSDINISTQKFWKNTIEKYTNGKYCSLIAKTTDNSEKLIFRFKSNSITCKNSYEE